MGTTHSKKQQKEISQFIQWQKGEALRLNKAAKTWTLMLLDAYFLKSFGEYASCGTPDYLGANISIVALFSLNDFKTKSCKTVMSIFSLNGTQGGF